MLHRNAALLFLFPFFLLIASFAGAETIEITLGDVDGFGFVDPSGLVDTFGDPADRDGDGMLGEGDSLPDLGGVPRIAPATHDFFDNQQLEDPAFSDMGMRFAAPLELVFDFALPPGEIVAEALFSLLAGDQSLLNEDLHVVSVDGFSTGETVEPRPSDGDITRTDIAVPVDLLPEFDDGSVTFSVSFDLAPDDVAIDHARLTLETMPVPEPSPALMRLSAFSAIAALAVRRRRAL